MTTKTTEAPDRPSQAEPPKELYRGPVDLDAIDVVSNVRKTFDPKKLKELTENVSKVGVLEPVLLRPNGKEGHFYLVAGERRLRAAKEAGLKEIPARVLQLDESAAAEIQAFENIHRADLSPIEEARAFELLFKTGKYDVKSLAQRVDKSEAYVYRSVKLLTLPPKLLEMIEEGEMTPAHGHQLLRVPEKERVRVYKEWTDDYVYEDGATTAAALRDFIEGQFGTDLANAAFPKDKPFAGEVACSACPSNSGNQGLLFDGAEKGKCLLRSCFDKKVAAEREMRIEEAKKAYPEAEVIESKQHVYEGKNVSGYIASVEYGKKGAPKKVAALVLNDGEIWLAVEAPKERKGNSVASGGGGSADRRSPKEAFIDRYLDVELFKKLVDEASPEYLTKLLVEDMTGGYFNQSYVERLQQVGLPDSGDKARAAALKLSPADRLKRLGLMQLARNASYGECDQHAKEAGIDVKEFKKATKAAADKAWDEKNKKPAAKGKK